LNQLKAQIKEQVLTVTVNDELLNIELPNGTSIITQTDLEACMQRRGNSLVVRLPMDGKLEYDRDCNLMMSLGSTYKWDANFFRGKEWYRLHCNHCDQLLLDSKDVTVINEMPSEIWAEMMDFWHCHKPHDHKVHEDRFSSLRPLSGGIVVGSYYIGFNHGDGHVHLDLIGGKCRCQCGYTVGEHDKATGLTKLFKWGFVTKSSIEETYDICDYIYISLLDNVNGSATRVVEYVSRDEHLLIWVFNARISYKTTHSDIKQGMKLYYTTDAHAIVQERNARGEFEVLDVSPEVMKGVLRYFEQQSGQFPPSIRYMGSWKLGLF
jgi:molybdopterin-binding protein